MAQTKNPPSWTTLLADEPTWAQLNTCDSSWSGQSMFDHPFSLSAKELDSKNLTWAQWPSVADTWQKFLILGAGPNQNDSLLLQLNSGQRVFCLVDALELVSTISKVTLQYPPDMLTLCDMYNFSVDILSQSHGQLEFCRIEEVPVDKQWSAALLLLEFTANKDGEALLTMQ